MNPEQKAARYIALLKRVIAEKHKGYKTYGALTGSALGSGVGGTVGLIKTIQKHREGELDELDNTDKIKEYLKSMGGHAAVGLGAGAVLGTGAGALGKRMSVNEMAANGKKFIEETLANPEDIEYLADNAKGVIRDAQKLPNINMMDAAKKQINSLLGKKANALVPVSAKSKGRAPNVNAASASSKGPFHTITGLKRGLAGYYGLKGGLGGTVLGSVGGAVKGFISPDEEIDPNTGEKVQKSRLSSAVGGALNGGLYGGLIGGGIGAGVGALRGHKLHPTFVAAANKMHNMDPNYLGAQTAATGRVHAPYDNVSAGESAAWRSRIDAIKAQLKKQQAAPIS